MSETGTTESTPPREKDGHCSVCGREKDVTNLKQPPEPNYYDNRDAVCDLCTTHGANRHTVDAAFDRQGIREYDDDHQAVRNIVRGLIRNADPDAVTTVHSADVDMQECRITVKATRTPHRSSNDRVADEAVVVVTPYGGDSDVYAGSAAAVWDALRELVDDDWDIKQSGFCLRLND